MYFKQKYQFYINYMSNLSRNCKCNIIIIAYFQSSASKMKNKLNTFPVYLNDYYNFLLYDHLTRKYCRSKMQYPLQYGIGLLILIISFLRRSFYIHVQKIVFVKSFKIWMWGVEVGEPYFLRHLKLICMRYFEAINKSNKCCQFYIMIFYPCNILITVFLPKSISYISFRYVFVLFTC